MEGPATLSALGAQMSCTVCRCFPATLRPSLASRVHHDLLARDALWTLVDKTECFHVPEYEQRVISVFEDSAGIIRTFVYLEIWLMVYRTRKPWRSSEGSRMALRTTDEEA